MKPLLKNLFAIVVPISKRACSAKVPNLSAKLKYKFDRRPRAVFDGVSVIVRTYCGCVASSAPKYKSYKYKN